MGKLKPVFEPAATVDVATLLARLTAARAGYLDNINNANLATIADISSLTATEIAYLANINNANIATIADISSLTATEIAHLDADISSRSTLAQSDILSDATPFAGGNVGTIKTQTDKLAGDTPSESSTTKNWKTVADSPDGTGGIVTTIGAAATRKKVHSLLLDVNGLTAAAAIKVKLFIKINGTSRKVYEESFTVGTDPDGLWIINGTLGIHDILTIVVYSDTDESKAIGYTAITEAM